MASDRTIAIRSLLLKAWRERWSDIQWGIHLKSVLPRGGSGDAYNLSGLILEQALVSPIPNSLMLSFLRHSLAARTISHGSLLEAIASHTDYNNLKGRPHCITALLDLVILTRGLISKRSKPDECATLNGALMKILSWLLKLFQSIIEAATSRSGQTLSPALTENARKIFTVLTEFQKDEFIFNLLYVSKTEDKDSYSKMASVCRQIESVMTSKNSTGVSMELKSFYSSEVILSLRSLDPLKVEAKSVSNASEQPSFVHSVQPMLVFEALFRPASDLTSLSQYLSTLTHILGNVNFSDLVYEILRSLLLTISQKEGLEPLKVDAFILVRLPFLLEKIYKLYKANEVTNAPLKTPTELYKAFDKLLANEALLDSTDLRCKCNIIDILLRIVATKSPTQLMTDTEKDDVLKKRQSRIDNAKVPIDNIPDSIIGNIRNFELTFKAEMTLDDVLSSFEGMDNTKPESVESLLSILQHVIKCESFDMWQAVTSATSKLGTLIQFLLKFNSQSQESQGESVKNSLNRAALFDMTFLMLVYSSQCFGIDVIKNALKKAPNEFISKWINDFMLESSNSTRDMLIIDNNVDNIMQQLANGELRTQVVKWQNVCCSIHQAFKEVIVAKSQGLVKDEMYLKMMTTMCSKLCALPVCVVAWMSNYKYALPASKMDLGEIASGYLKIAEETTAAATNDVPYVKERVAMMSSILRRFMVQAGAKDRVTVSMTDESYDCKTAQMLNPAQTSEPLEESLCRVWSKICAKSYVDIETAWQLRFLYKAGGAHWFASVLVKSLMNVSYQDDLNKQTELLRAIFHIDIEQTTLSLLQHVIPQYLQCKTNREMLTDPRGTALAKLTVGCLFIVLSDKKDPTSKKRPANSSEFSTMEDEPSSKMLKLAQGSGGVAAEHLDKEATKHETEQLHPMGEAMSGFFKLLNAVLLCQESHVTPVTHFAFRILEQIALKGSKSRSRLILQHVSLNLVMHLVKILPDMFSMAIVSRLFDVSTSTGRKNMAKVMCMLRFVQVQQEAAHVATDQNRSAAQG